MSSPLSSSTQPSPLSPLNGSGGSSSSDNNNGKDKSYKKILCIPINYHGCTTSYYCPPPSFNNPQTKNTRPTYLFPLFFLINIITMMDRSIIAGATQEFSTFVSTANDSPSFVIDNPDSGIGLLQSSFIFGYAVSLLLSGHYVHKIPWIPLVLCSLCVWWLGVLGSGNAKKYNSFYVLLFSRMATGCSEAAFQVVAPPIITDRGGKHSGLWLSIYLTGLPLGLAFGYIYGSKMASSDVWGWDWAYYWIAIASLPVILTFSFVKDETNGGILGGEDAVDMDNVMIDSVDQEDGGNDETSSHLAQQPLLGATEDEEVADTTTTQALQQPMSEATESIRSKKKHHFTLFTEIKVCLSSPVLVTLSLGWAAIIGVVASLGTFGTSFTLALQLYDDERSAAYWFGIAAATAGLIGTPLGGKLADRILERYNSRNNTSRSEGVEESLRLPIISSMLPKINTLTAVAMCFVFPTLAMQDAAPFLTFLFLGWTLLFMTQTQINLVAMLSVEHCDRPNAVAFLMLTSHLLGDVPLPIILGLIKDKLAPDCVIDDSGSFVDPEKCKEQEKGVRQSLAIAYAWVLWALFFFELARRLAKREIGRIRSTEHNTLLLQEEESSQGVGHDGDTPPNNNRPFHYYHSKFQPHQAIAKEEEILNGNGALQ